MTLDDFHDAVLAVLGNRLRTAAAFPTPCSCNGQHVSYTATCACDSEPDFSGGIVRCSSCHTAFRVEWS
jgi:hypothetical protein